jgi:hypothetical protein
MSVWMTRIICGKTGRSAETFGSATFRSVGAAECVRGIVPDKMSDRDARRVDGSDL